MAGLQISWVICTGTANCLKICIPKFCSCRSDVADDLSCCFLHCVLECKQSPEWMNTCYFGTDLCWGSVTSLWATFCLQLWHWLHKSSFPGETVVPVSKIPNQNQVWFLELVLESEFIRGSCLYTAAMSCNLQTFCGKESWLLAVGYNMQDDPHLSDYNVPELVDLFVEYVQNQVHNAAFTQTSDSGLCKCNSPFSLSFWV
jgi:hypothetical protein